MLDGLRDGEAWWRGLVSGFRLRERGCDLTTWKLLLCFIALRSFAEFPFKRLLLAPNPLKKQPLLFLPSLRSPSDNHGVFIRPPVTLTLSQSSNGLKPPNPLRVLTSGCQTRREQLALWSRLADLMEVAPSLPEC